MVFFVFSRKTIIVLRPKKNEKQSFQISDEINNITDNPVIQFSGTDTNNAWGKCQIVTLYSDRVDFESLRPLKKDRHVKGCRNLRGCVPPAKQCPSKGTTYCCTSDFVYVSSQNVLFVRLKTVRQRTHLCRLMAPCTKTRLSRLRELLASTPLPRRTTENEMHWWCTGTVGVMSRHVRNNPNNQSPNHLSPSLRSRGLCSEVERGQYWTWDKTLVPLVVIRWHIAITLQGVR